MRVRMVMVVVVVVVMVMVMVMWINRHHTRHVGAKKCRKFWVFGHSLRRALTTYMVIKANHALAR